MSTGPSHRLHILLQAFWWWTHPASRTQPRAAGTRHPNGSHFEFFDTLFIFVFFVKLSICFFQDFFHF